MQNPAKRPFDNVALLLRGPRCLLASVWSPFITAYWPDVEAAGGEVGIANGQMGAVGQPEPQTRLLRALADKALKDGRFRPASIGFKASPEAVRRREGERHSYRLVKFLGRCSREVVFQALEDISSEVQKGGRIDVCFKGWEPLSDWTEAKERMSDVIGYIGRTRECRCNVTLFSELGELPADLWEFCYEHPRIRLAWLALDLLCCEDHSAFEAYRSESVAFSNLCAIGDSGLWPHVVLPVSKVNLGVLGEMLEALLEATRGASMDLEPLPFALAGTEADGGSDGGGLVAEAPDPGEYAEALVRIYLDGRVPVALVSPLSWAAARVRSRVPLSSSAVSTGVEVAVLASGDLYASEWGIGTPRWRLGNVLEDSQDLRWERLDAMAEAFSYSLMPAECASCEWRYRCGGLDGSVFLMEERLLAAALPSAPVEPSKELLRSGQALLRNLYCEPRKRLLEELLWGSAEAGVQGRREGPRERLKLQADGIEFENVTNGKS